MHLYLNVNVVFHFSYELEIEAQEQQRQDGADRLQEQHHLNHSRTLDSDRGRSQVQ